MFSEISKKKLKNGGFSLIELIIVVAIMVALVAVLAPSYVKYINKARNTAVQNAAEDCIEFVKTEFGLALTGEGAVQIGVNPSNKKIEVSFIGDSENGGINTLSYKNEAGETGIDAFKKDVGFKNGVTSQSELIYVIRIQCDDVANHPEQANIFMESNEESL